MKVGFLIDMDGVIYRGQQVIPGTPEFLRKLLDENIPFVLLTNNSQRTRRDIVTKLGHMGIRLREEHIFTCAMATARYLAKRKPGGTAYVIGEGGLLTALHHNGYSIDEVKPDYVVIGEGRTITMETVDKAVNMVLQGAKLVATNLDPNCPVTETTIRPGCGAYAAMIEKATGIRAFSVGKPSPVMMRAARKELGLKTEETVVIGDNMETDILGGVQLSYRTVLTLSGATRREDLHAYAYGPDLIVRSINDLNHPEVYRSLVG